MTNLVIPPPQEWIRTGFTIPVKLVEALGELLKEINAERDKPDKLSRDALVIVLLEWAMKEHADQKKRGRP